VDWSFDELGGAIDQRVKMFNLAEGTLNLCFVRNVAAFAAAERDDLPATPV
jgi:hypothetical protein